MHHCPDCVPEVEALRRKIMGMQDEIDAQAQHIKDLRHINARLRSDNYAYHSLLSAAERHKDHFKVWNNKQADLLQARKLEFEKVKQDLAHVEAEVLLLLVDNEKLADELRFERCERTRLEDERKTHRRLIGDLGARIRELHGHLRYSSPYQRMPR